MPTSTSTPQTVLKEQCVEMLPAFPMDSVPPGILVAGRSLMNFRQQEQRTISGGLGVGVSPNRKWLAYVTINDDVDGLTLHVESADGQKKKQLPFEQNWAIFGDILWLNNERIIFPFFDGKRIITSPFYDRKEPLPTLVLNTLTGEQQVLLADYPNFAPFRGTSTQLALHFGYNNVVYNPSLKLVIYPQQTDDGSYIALWDRETGQTVAKVLSRGLHKPSPLWLPNGNAFVVAAFPEKDRPREWFMVSRDGDALQLTHLGELYSQYNFGDVASLSPDGRYLAFGFYIDDQVPILIELVILNLQTLEAVNTCVRLTDTAIVWSPDSQYLAVQYWDHDNPQYHSSFVVLDIKQRWAVNMSTSRDWFAIPRGWLASGE
jgi:Tol biopolymer transport system component